MNSGFRYKLIRACFKQALVRNIAHCVGVRTSESGIDLRLRYGAALSFLSAFLKAGTGTTVGNEGRRTEE